MQGSSYILLNKIMCDACSGNSISRGNISLSYFARNSISIETSPYCNSIYDHRIRTNFARATTACLWCHVQNLLSSLHQILMRAKRNSHGIWIAMVKQLVKWAPVGHSQVEHSPIFLSSLLWCHMQGFYKSNTYNPDTHWFETTKSIFASHHSSSRKSYASALLQSR